MTTLHVRPVRESGDHFVDGIDRTRLDLRIGTGSDYTLSDQLRRTLRAGFRQASTTDTEGHPRYTLTTSVTDLRAWERVRRAAERAGLTIEHATGPDGETVASIIASWAERSHPIL